MANEFAPAGGLSAEDLRRPSVWFESASPLLRRALPPTIRPSTLTGASSPWRSHARRCSPPRRSPPSRDRAALPLEPTEDGLEELSRHAGIARMIPLALHLTGDLSRADRR